jgi:hypothetical protein
MVGASKPPSFDELYERIRNQQEGPGERLFDPDPAGE